MDGHESDSGDEEQRREAMCVAASLLIVDSATQTEQEEAEFEDLHKRLESDAMLAAETAVEGDGESDDLFGIGSPFGMASHGVEERIRGSLMGACVREAGKLLPGPGRGRSEANAAASNTRRNLKYPDGIYEAWCQETTCPFQRNTGFRRNEFDDFYTAQGGDEGHLFRVPRDIDGQFTPAENSARRTIKGTLRYRDRVLCWLMMLRRGCCFHEMTTLFGPGESTFCRDFLWMTIQAATLPCLVDEIAWPSMEERQAQAAFLAATFHPRLANVAYIADGTKGAAMRNPTEPKDGRPKVRRAVHGQHYSHNKGLGYSHIVYVNARGKPIRVETVSGRLSDRAAHTASRLFLEPDAFLTLGETGMGDGNYRGDARMDSTGLEMCVPFQFSPNLTHEQRDFNSQQRRVRVVVENTIGQIKKFRVIGEGRFDHQRDFEPHVFELCARLTARIMRVRNAYPRSEEWLVNQVSTWESKLGVFLWMDPGDAASYLVHGLVEDAEYDTDMTAQQKAELLQGRWEAIWGAA
ncbi:unnamed protein product [Ectocarpus sp. 13 AM-2016]